MINAVIYARYSSDNQREESIDAQLRICRKHCEERGYNIVHEYIDEAFTATNDRRPDYQQMIKDAKKGGFQVVVFHKVNRNARNEYDYYFHKMQLNRAGVAIEYAGQAFDAQTPEGQLMENQLVGMAAYFSRNLSKEVKKGLKENALKCIHNGGIPPLGYDVGPDKKYVINEAEARTVRLIFDMYVNGKSYTEISQECNRRGYRTKAGTELRKTSLYDIIGNRKYAGFYVYGKTKSTPNMPRNSHLEDKDMYVIENGLPPIISIETWQKACERRSEKKRKRGSYRAKANYLLAGLIKCGECGNKMQGSTYTNVLKNGETVRRCYYRCVHCKAKSINGIYLEKQVIDIIRQNILNPKNAITLTESINKQLKETSTDVKAESASLQAKITSLEQANDKLMHLLETTDISELLIARIKKNSENITSARERLQELNAQCQEEISVERIKFLISAWNNVNDDDGFRSMINTFVRSVIVYGDHIDIDMFLPVNLNEYTSDELKKTIEKEDLYD
ncbi:MAG: recombinase family protein [Selenomonas sp.]|nr:recombinase family protein [Selenomonas sp.]